MTEAHAGAALIAERNRAQFIPCKAFLRDAEQALAAFFCLNWVFLTFRGRKLLYPLPYSAWEGICSTNIQVCPSQQIRNQIISFIPWLTASVSGYNVRVGVYSNI